MAHFTRKTDRSNIRNKKVRYVTRQDLVDEKYDCPDPTDFGIPTHTKDELLKMEKRVVLESYYYSFQRTNPEVKDVEIALAEMHAAFTNTRYHILAAERNMTNDNIYTVMQMYAHGQLVHYNNFIAHSGWYLPVTTSRNSLEQSRLLLYKIYVVRYPETRLGKFFKQGLNSKQRKTPKGEGLRDWLTVKICMVREWFAGVWTNAKTALPNAIQSVYDLILKVKNYVSDSISHVVTNVSAKVVMLIITTISIIGICGIALIPIVRKLLVWISADESTEFNQSDDCVIAEGGEERSKSILGATGAIITKTLDKTATFDPEAWFNKFGKYANNFNSIERSLTSIWDHLRRFVEFAYEKVTGKPLSDLGVLSKEIEVYTKVINDQRMQYAKSKRLNSEDAKIVHEAAEKLKTKLAEKLHVISPGLASTVSVTLLNAIEVIESAREIMYGAKTRPMPVWVHLVGEPGVGKTILTDRKSVV